jgi:hypothetical protein
VTLLEAGLFNVLGPIIAIVASDTVNLTQESKFPSHLACSTSPMLVFRVSVALRKVSDDRPYHTDEKNADLD